MAQKTWVFILALILAIILALMLVPPYRIVFAPDAEATENPENFIPIPLLKVAFCESGIRHWDDKGNVIQGRVNKFDTGIFQINRQIHAKELQSLHLNPFDILDNIRFAKVLYEKSGLKPWEASKPCWSKLE